MEIQHDAETILTVIIYSGGCVRVIGDGKIIGYEVDDKRKKVLRS